VSVAARLSRLENEGQSEVCDAGRHVRLDEDVFGLEVSVGDGRLHVDIQSRLLRNLLVQVGQAARHRQRDLAQVVPTHHVRL